MRKVGAGQRGDLHDGREQGLLGVLDQQGRVGFAGRAPSAFLRMLDDALVGGGQGRGFRQLLEGAPRRASWGTTWSMRVGLLGQHRLDRVLGVAGVLEAGCAGARA